MNIGKAYANFFLRNNTTTETSRRYTCCHLGFTLIELLMVIAIIGTLASIAVPNFISYRQKAIDLKAIVEIKAINLSILAFSIENGRLPVTLAEAGLGVPLDPYGNPWVYHPVDSVPPGHLRKDHALVPVNTDYDLYSKGKDGKSSSPFTATASKDDIVRASNGGFFGYAKDY